MRVARTTILTAVLALLSSVSVSAQDPLPTEPPTQSPGARLSASTHGWDDPVLNSVIQAATRSASVAIGGRKKIRVTTRMSGRNVSRAARDAAEGEFDAVILSGGSSLDTVRYALLFGNTIFIEIAQDAPCVTADRLPDPSGTCAGGTRALPFNYMAVSFAEDQAGYLAGIIAAAASLNDRIGIIGGTPTCEICNRYMQGFELGARSLKPDIEITKTFLSASDAVTGFTDNETARTFAETFIDVYQPDVLFPVARANTLSMLEAACDADILIVGSDLDLSRTQPHLAKCVLTSAIKPIEEAVVQSIRDFSSRSLQPVKRYDATNGGISVTSEWQRISGLPVNLFDRVDDALEDMRSGLIVTCPEHCGQPDPALPPESVAFAGA
jgi:basic membrane lipoprotein Med (substrate-binding protein (PBP1-ABC) superfamily)